MSCLVLVGCEAPADGVLEAEGNDLGITHIKVDHHTDGADRFLDVYGLGENGAEIASATLRTGMVRYSAEPELTPPEWNAGTELTISSGEQSLTFASPDRVAHKMREPIIPVLAKFVRLRAVAAAISAEAGIEFARVDGSRTGEAAYGVSTCNGSHFPTNKGNPTQCCENTGTFGATFHKVAGTSILGIRNLYASACRDSGGGTGCSGAGCYYGPCSAAPYTGIGNPNTTAATVFYPTNDPNQCGADSNGASSGGGYENPQPYVNQSLYPGVTATCQWTDCCLASNGVTYRCIGLGGGAYEYESGFPCDSTVNCNSRIGSGGSAQYCRQMNGGAWAWLTQSQTDAYCVNAVPYPSCSTTAHCASTTTWCRKMNGGSYAWWTQQYCGDSGTPSWPGGSTSQCGGLTYTCCTNPNPDAWLTGTCP